MQSQYKEGEEKMKQNDRPKFRRYQFAENANESTIEEVPDIQTTEKEAEGYIGYKNGFTRTNMIPILEGGKPPRGQQINQLFKDITQITQYKTVGGMYDINTEVINYTGYPKNAIVCIDDAGLFRSLQDDNKETDYNNTTYWQKIVDFNPPKYIQRILGKIFYAIRTDTPNGCLKCDGNTYQSKDYPKLISYLKANKIAKVDLKSYDNEISANGGCIRFGYDNNGSTFRVPKIPSGYFLSNPDGQIIANKSTINPKQGSYVKDQIVNITGSINNGMFYTTKNEIVSTEAINFKKEEKELSIREWSGGRLSIVTLRFNSSNIVTTGDRVMPRTMFTPAFVVVDDVYTEKV